MHNKNYLSFSSTELLLVVCRLTDTDFQFYTEKKQLSPQF